jgi:hypothetical protein
VNGTVNATSFSGDGSLLTNLQGDNLGNHVALQNIQLGSHWLSGDGGSEGIFINANGNVGLNQNTPEYAFDMIGDQRIKGCIYIDEGDGLPLFIKFRSALTELGEIEFDDNSFSLDHNSDRLRIAGGSLRFGTNTYPIATRFYVSSNSEVGINTAAPAEKLHIKGDAGSATKVRIEGNTSLLALEYFNETVFGASMGYSITNDQIFFYHGGTHVIVKGGKLGVGKNTIDAGKVIDVAGGAYCSGSTWYNSSDKNLKENFIPVNGQEILEKVANMEISTWNYKEDPDDVRHIGPVAQDFFAGFGMGQDDVSISTIDADGVSLAAIQELYRQNQEMKAMILELKQQLEEIKPD